MLKTLLIFATTLRGIDCLWNNSVKYMLNYKPVPLVIWHGMGDSCCNPLSIGRIMKLIEREIPNIYVYSIKIGNNQIEDIENSYIGNVNNQIKNICEKIATDEMLQNGYNALGLSQGAQFLRGVAQRCPQPPMKNLISLGGQHQGAYGFPRCPTKHYLCEKIRDLISQGAYLPFIQKAIIQAQYWHDPNNEQEYRAESLFLADINNENEINEKYKTNINQLQKMVLIKFLNDTMVNPKESEWFGFFAANDTASVEPMERTKLYIEDRIGLKRLNEDGKLDFVAFEGEHLQITESTFASEIIDKYLR